MNKRITTENYDILLNGSIITLLDEPIKFELAELNIYIKFENNKKKDSLVKNSLDDLGLVLIMTNCNSPLGIGNTEPLQIGTINGKKLLFNYMVYSLCKQSKNKLFHYSWFLEKEISNE